MEQPPFTLPDHLSKASLIDLRHYMEISVRAYNACVNYNLLQLSDLLAFYLKENGFLKLRNVGRKTTEELQAICQWLLKQDGGSIEILPLSEEAQRLIKAREIAPLKFSPTQIRLLNAYIKQCSTVLSVRSRTALSNYLRGNIDYAMLHHFFFEKQINSSKIKNVGKKSFQEILEFVERLRAKAEKVMQQPDEYLEIDLVADQICEDLSLSHDLFERYLPEIRDKKFPVFRFFRDLILNYHFFDKRHLHIIRFRAGWFHTDEVLGMDAIGQQLGITRERVRQIANKIEEDFVEKIAFINVQKNILLQITSDLYKLDTSRDLLLVRRQLANDINHVEGTDFSPRFFSMIFAALYADSHLLFGRQFDFFQNEYLLRRDLLEGFDAASFVTDMKNLTGERIKEDFSLDLEGYLLKFLKSGNSNKIITRIRYVCADLLMLEFSEQVRLELPNQLVICRNIRQQAWEYALEALETIGNPAKLAEIHRAIVEKYPDFDSNAQALRSILIKEKSHFISFSRTSTYGLAKWETEFEDIRGGSIRDIVEEYLLQCDQPKHCHDITDFVLRYRPSSSSTSIHGNLQLDESKRFIYLGQGFWGLSKRDYKGFRAPQMPKQVFGYLKVWLTVNPDGSVDEAIEYLSKRCHVQTVQIKGWMAEKIKNGILRLEQDKLTIIQ